MRNKLRQIRKLKGLNQRQFAELTHTSQSLISSIENGKMVPWPAVIKRVCAVLNNKPEEIFPGIKVNKKDSAESLAAPAESANQSTNVGDYTHGN